MTHGFAYQPSRRQMIRSLVGGSVLMPGILSEMFSDAALGQGNPLAPRPSHFGPRAKRVIFLFQVMGYAVRHRLNLGRQVLTAPWRRRR